MPAPAKLSECRDCKKPIRWATTRRGSKMPLDPDPVPDGNVVLEVDGVARVLSRGEQHQGPGARYASHFNTCPASKNWSGRSRDTGPRSDGGAARRRPAPANPVTSTVDAIRDAVWRLKTGAEPVLTANVLLCAAVQVLRANGRSTEELRDAVSRAAEVHT